MLGVLITIVTVAAVAFAVTQVGGIITLLFIAAVLFLAYKRLSLIAFAATFTVLLAAYSVLGHPAGIWKGLLWVMLALLWLFTIRPLRKSLVTRPFMKAYLRMLPKMSQTEREALEAGTVWWDGELFTGAPKWEKLFATKPPQLSPRSRPFAGPCESCAACSMTGTSRTCAATCRRPCGISEEGLLRDDHPEEVRRLEFSAMRILRAEKLAPQHDRLVDRRRAELARPCGTAQPLRD